MRDITPAPKPDDTSHLKTLSNGAIYDLKKGRIVSNPGGGTHAITSANASKFAQLRREKKRAAMIAAANAVAQQGGGVDGRQFNGNTAYIEAITESMTMKALTPTDPKAVDAARFLFQETGIAETTKHDGDTPAQETTVINVIMAQYINALSQPAEEQIHETIDADAEDV